MSKAFFWVSIVFMIIFLNDYMIFLPMLMYSNVNQALKHWMLISIFFFLMLEIEWRVVRLLHPPFPLCPLKEAVGPTQMEGLQVVWGTCCPSSVKIHGRRAWLLVLDPLASGSSQTSLLGVSEIPNFLLAPRQGKTILPWEFLLSNQRVHLIH